MASALKNGTYNIVESPYGQIVCYPQFFLFEKAEQQGWESGSALASSLPFFITQLFVANLSYRILYYLTRPLYLPPFVPQILAGVLFSRPLLGQVQFIREFVFPLRFTMVLETFGNLALVYNIFLLGLEMDISMIKLTDMKPLSIALAGVVVPFLVGSGLYYLPGNGLDDKLKSGCIFWAITLSCTNFPDLARILADLKLLRTDVGKTAMSAAILTDLCTWVLLIVVFSAFNKENSFNQMMPYVLLSTVAFILFCIYVGRPAVSWLFLRTIKGGHMSDMHVWFILGSVVLCGIVTDACGTHSITGAFMFGLVIPQDHMIRNMIEEKLHDFLAGILMPLFFIISGLRSNLQTMFQDTHILAIFLVIVVSFVVKISTTFVVSLCHRMPTGDAMAVGLLMNTKGILALVVLNSGRETKALDSPTFTLMMVVLFVVSLVGEPLLAATYKRKKQFVHYKIRTIQTIKQETEFRILACIHNFPHASGIVNLLQISNATKESPLHIFAVHLVELTGRTTASMMIMNDECKPKVNFSDRVRAESDQISEAFDTIEVNNEAAKVQTVTAVSPYPSMHEDICGLAEDKHVSFIILPYHKQLTADGRMGEGNASHADINHNVLEHAPCSVAILVDQGMGMTRSESVHGDVTKKQVAMLFLGGPDDREALMYAWRMAGDHSINLTVVRFIPGREALMSSMNGKSASLYEREKQVDDECIYEFNFKTMNESSVTYIEKVVNDGQDTVATIRDMEENHSYDLYIVGRGYGVDSPVTSGLSDWNRSPELGTIGDSLASSNFTMHASVLVVQQYSVGYRHAAAVDDHELSHGQHKTSYDIEAFMKSGGRDSSDHGDDDEEYEYSVRK